MKIRTMKKTLLALWAVCLIGPASWAAEADSPIIGMPNPIVTCDTYADAAHTTGFAPLYLTRGSGFELNYISVISKHLADLGFRSHTTGASVRVRTALASDEKGTEDISGIYSVRWNTHYLSGVTVFTATVAHNEYAAHWQVGKYLFSAHAKQMTRSEFYSLLKYQLVDASAHYYLTLSE